MSKISRSGTRKILFQKLYSDSFGNFSFENFKKNFFHGKFHFEMDEEYFSQMHTIIFEKEKYLIAILKKYAPKFQVEQMSKIYVFPIFIALGEMFFYSDEIPGKVSINEAVEVSKFYGDDSTKKIVNGVLNNVYKNNVEVKKYIDELKELPEFSFFEKK